MEIYFYCSYEHSQSGFFLTRLEPGGLIPAEGGAMAPPEPVRNFFSYDRFQFLWRDFCQMSDKWEAPLCTGGLCGIRELRGQMMPDGRGGTVNLAFLAGPDELVLLRRVALSILGDMDAFRQMLFSWLSVGGSCGYEINAQAFLSWVGHCGLMCRLRRLVPPEHPAAQLLPFLAGPPPKQERDTLHLAVCTCDWQVIGESMGNPKVWRRKPACALSPAEFSAAFTGRGPVWSMEA